MKKNSNILIVTISGLEDSQEIYVKLILPENFKGTKEEFKDLLWRYTLEKDPYTATTLLLKLYQTSYLIGESEAVSLFTQYEAFLDPGKLEIWENGEDESNLLYEYE